LPFIIAEAEIKADTAFIQKNEIFFQELKERLQTHQIPAPTITNILNELSSKEFLSRSKELMKGDGYKIRQTTATSYILGITSTQTRPYTNVQFTLESNGKLALIYDDSDTPRIDAKLREGDGVALNDSS
jgi:hypothetical protein